MRKSNVSCIVLAGGRGKRFNQQDKGLVKLNDKPLIQHVIESITPQVDDIVISANRNLDFYQSYTNKVIKDNAKNYQGPLTGIASCLPECKHEWVLIVPCDIPSLPKNLVSKLQAKNTRLLSIAIVNNKKQLTFLMHKSLTEKLLTYVEQGEKKVMDWVKQQKPHEVSFNNDNNTFLNINTPDDLKTKI